MSEEVTEEAASPAQDPEEQDVERDKLSIKYTEASDYRVIHVDGAQGSFTQSGNFFFKLYAEHPSFPERIVRAITEEGQLGEILEVHEGPGMERRMECGVMIDLETLRELHAFLGRQLEQLEQLNQTQADEPDAEHSNRG